MKKNSKTIVFALEICIVDPHFSTVEKEMPIIYAPSFSKLVSLRWEPPPICSVNIYRNGQQRKKKSAFSHTFAEDYHAESTTATGSKCLTITKYLPQQHINNRMARVENDLNDRVSTPLLCGGSSTTRPGCQSHIQPGLECLQRRGIHNVLGQRVPVCHYPLCKKLRPNI